MAGLGPDRDRDYGQGQRSPNRDPNLNKDLIPGQGQNRRLE